MVKDKIEVEVCARACCGVAPLGWPLAIRCEALACFAMDLMNGMLFDVRAQRTIA